MLTAYGPAWFDQYRHYLRLIDGESDRAAAVLGVAYVDALLKQILVAHFREGGPTRHLLRDRGSFDSMALKADLLFALGLVPLCVHSELGILTAIRNHFAHELEAHSFSDSKPTQLCGELELSNTSPVLFSDSSQKSTPRLQFEWTVARLLSELSGLLTNVTRCAPIDLPVLQRWRIDA